MLVPTLTKVSALVTKRGKEWMKVSISGSDVLNGLQSLQMQNDDRISVVKSVLEQATSNVTVEI